MNEYVIEEDGIEGVVQVVHHFCPPLLKVSSGFLAYGGTPLLLASLFSKEQQEAMLVVGQLVVNRPQFMQFHPLVTLGAPNRLFRTHSDPQKHFVTTVMRPGRDIQGPLSSQFEPDIIVVKAWTFSPASPVASLAHRACESSPPSRCE